MDPGFLHPEGLVAFELRGQDGPGCPQSQVNLLAHGEADLSGAEYRKYGPTAAQPWPPQHATFATTTVGGRAVASVSMVLIDGGPGDDDRAANGVITDPGGPAFRAATQIEIPALTSVGLGALVVVLTLLGVIVLRRRSV